MEKKVTYAEAILVDEIKVLKVFNVLNVHNDLKLPTDPKDPNDPNDPNDLNNLKDLNDPNLPKDLKPLNRRILVAGNRSGGVAVAAMRRWPDAEVVAHAFDYHHARAIRKRLLDEGLPARNVRCSAGVGTMGTDPMPAVGTDPMLAVGTDPIPECQPFDVAFFMTTPQSMPAELVLDQLQDIHANLAEGGTLYAAFEGDPDEALKTMRLVWKNVNVLKRAKHAVLFRAVKRGAPVKIRDFAATWEASVPGGEPLTFTTYPGCFCHRRPDAGGLALAEVAAREVKGEGGKVKGEGGKVNDEEEGKTPFTLHHSPFTILDMGCGCGLVGLLVVDAIRRQSSISNPQSSILNPQSSIFNLQSSITLIDSHARAIAAAKLNAARAGIEAEFILSDDGLPRGRVGEYDLFVGNPPYYSDYRIAEVFLETAYRALKPGGVCLTVVKTATGLLALQEKYFRKAEVIKRRGYCVLRSVR